MSASAPAVEARALEKWYGPLPAVRGIDFTLAPGELVTVFGPNGAGKSTLLRLLCGAVRPTRGAVRIGGVDVAASDAARRRIGLLSHQALLYPGLTAAERFGPRHAEHGSADPRRRTSAGVLLRSRQAARDAPRRAALSRL